MRGFACAAAVLAVVASAEVSRANPMDITLSRLYNDTRRCRDALAAQGGRDELACADQAAFRQLAREFGLAIAPALLAPSETLGYAGFYLGLEGNLTVINASNDPANVWDRATEDRNPDPVLFVSSVHARKGLPASFELGTSVSYIAATELVLLGVDVRWALLEGYRSGWKGIFPDVSVRGAVNRLTGDDELDMTVWSFDVSLSRPFAIAGMMTITPYAGYQFIQTIADNSLVLNAMTDPPDPGEEPEPPADVPETLLDCRGGAAEYQRNCVGNDVYGPRGIRYLDFEREFINRHRGFIGIRFLYEHFATIIQVALTDGQQSYSLSIGLDY